MIKVLKQDYKDKESVPENWKEIQIRFEKIAIKLLYENRWEFAWKITRYGKIEWKLRNSQILKIECFKFPKIKVKEIENPQKREKEIKLDV